jgi:hypothetical protein
MSENIKEATAAFITSMAQKKKVMDLTVSYMTAIVEKDDVINPTRATTQHTEQTVTNIRATTVTEEATQKLLEMYDQHDDYTDEQLVRLFQIFEGPIKASVFMGMNGRREKLHDEWLRA